MKASRPRVQQSVSKSIILMSISNHMIWSSHHVLSRYLQVKANPPMDGMIALSTGKLAAMVMTFFWGDYVSSWCKGHTLSPDEDPSKACPTLAMNDSKAPSSRNAVSTHSTPRKLASTSSHTSLGGISTTREDDRQISQQVNEESETFKESCKKLETFYNSSTEPVCWNKTHILILNALLTTTRASLNVVSDKYATSYNLCELQYHLLL